MKLKSIIITLFLSFISFTVFSQVPDSERAALVALYNATNGSNWKENTNWNTSQPVNTWYGVTVTDNKVSALNLSNNNLIGSIPSELSNLSKLHSLVLSKNSLRNVVPSGLLPDNTNINVPSLFIDISENNFIFQDIETNFNSYYRDPYGYKYAPQAKVDLEETINKNVGESHTFTISLLSTNNTYQWYKDGVAIDGANQKDYTISSISVSDSGSYYVVVTNSIVTTGGGFNNLKLQRNSVQLNVNNNTDVPKAERDALIALFNATNGLGWNNNTNWNTSEPVSTWYGVTVENGSVTKLDLNSNNLSGFLPSDIGNLTSLKYFNLGGNYFLRSTIPIELGNLTKLTFLGFPNCKIYGSIPTELGNLSELKLFAASNNELSGSIPKELGNLAKLETLILANNRLTGSLPVELGNLSALKTLDFRNNSLSGNIPSEYQNLSKLLGFDVANNNFSGQIPVAIFSLPAIIGLDVSDNNFSGVLPSITRRFGDLVVKNNNYRFSDLEPNFTSIKNYATRFIYFPQSKIDDEEIVNKRIGQSYTFSSSITPSSNNKYQWYKDGVVIDGANQKEYTISSISDTDEGYYYVEVNNDVVTDLTLVRSSIKLEVENLASDREALIALYNATDGSNWTNNTNWNTNEPINTWYGVTAINGKVTQINLINNNLNGTLPSEIGNLLNLSTLYLSVNKLSGKIPVEIGSLTSLRYLSIDRNNLTGSIPSEMGNLSQLYNLNLSQNNFSGVIPSTLSSLKNLSYLALSYNSLIGNVPSEFDGLINLKVLSLSGNELTGLVPIFPNLKNLENLYLSGNKFSSFPDVTPNLIKLKGISLEKNLISSLPNDISNLTALESLRISYNSITGELSDNIVNLLNLKILDLSQNKITIFPDNLQNLKNLVDLNLFGNNLTSIPTSIGSLTNLYSLNLSSNDITGNIPVELGKLTKLRTLSMASNKLTGSIPNELGNLIDLRTVFFAKNKLSGAIPGNLINLPNLQTLHLYDNELSGNLPLLTNKSIQQFTIYQNNFIFSNLTEQFSNYKTNINLFSFLPQAKVDKEEAIDLASGDSHILKISLNDANNKYQWYKNRVAIPGANDKTYTITNASAADIGEYYCSVTNDEVQGLILQRNLIRITVDGSNVNCSVTEAEKNALIALYNATDGENWTRNENWLTDKSVCEWEGVGNFLGQSLVLSNNNLKGALPPEIGDLENFALIVLEGNELVGSIPLEVTNLKKLQYFLLSNNKLSGSIPKGLVNIESLKQFHINANNYKFSDIESVYQSLKEKLDVFNYSPQNEFDTLIEKEITVDSSFPMATNLLSENNTYQWYKNDVLISGATEKNFIINKATIDDSGVYHTVVKNTMVPALELKRRPINLKVVNEITCQESNIIVSSSTAIKCINNPIDFTFIDQLGFKDATYVWTFYDLDGTTILNTSTEEKPSFTYNTIGEYLVKLQINHADGCNFKTNTFIIKDCEPTVEPAECDNCNSFKPVPGKKYVISGWVKENREIVCSPGVITSLKPTKAGMIKVNLTPQGESSYINVEQSLDQVNWTKFRLDNPSSSFDLEPLSKGVIYFRFNSEYCEEYSETISVDFRPPSVAILSPAIISLKEETSFDLSVTGSDSEIVSWSVNFGDGTIITGDNVNKPLPKTVKYIYTTAGSYQITFTITNKAGFTASTTKLIGVTEEFLTLNKVDGAIRAKPGDIVYIKINISGTNNLANQLTLNVKSSSNGPSILTNVFFNSESVTQFVMPSSGIAYLTAEYFVEPDVIDPDNNNTRIGAANVKLSLSEANLNTTPFNLQFTLTGDGDFSKFPTLK